MSEQVTPQQATQAEPAPGNRWDDPISEERQAELQGYLDRWQAETDHGERRGPFDKSPGELGVSLTGADVAWLADQSGRDRNGGVPNLHLEGARLNEAHLAGPASTKRTWRERSSGAPTSRGLTSAGRIWRGPTSARHIWRPSMSIPRRDRTSRLA
jgi:hypothetical protein